jgi:hypothetical protein
LTLNPYFIWSLANRIEKHLFGALFKDNESFSKEVIIELFATQKLQKGFFLL